MIKIGSEPFDAGDGIADCLRQRRFATNDLDNIHLFLVDIISYLRITLERGDRTVTIILRPRAMRSRPRVRVQKSSLRDKRYRDGRIC